MPASAKKAPPRPAPPLIALLRGINVGGHHLVPMEQLRKLAVKAGCSQVSSYIQSGNLVFTPPPALGPVEVEAALAAQIEGHFGFSIEVIVRTAAQWARYAPPQAFAEAAAQRPQRVLLGRSKRPPQPGAAALLHARAAAGERVEVLADGLWLDFAEGIGSSKLTPAVLDKAVGSTVTARNWTTVLRLGELAQLLSSQRG